MADSQISNDPNPKRVTPLRGTTKATHWVIISLLIGAIVATAAFFIYRYRSLPHAYSSPNKSEQNQSSYEFTPESVPTEPDYSYTPEYSPADFEAELEMNRMKWNSKLITHYRMSVDLPQLGSVYIETPWIVEVQEGDVISVVNAQGQAVSPADYEDFSMEYQYYFTVPALFSYVEQTYQDQPPVIRVEYDPTYGYPRIIYVDPWVEPCCMDSTIEVRDLQELP